jgi:hypothetical protein
MLSVYKYLTLYKNIQKFFFLQQVQVLLRSVSPYTQEVPYSQEIPLLLRFFWVIIGLYSIESEDLFTPLRLGFFLFLVSSCYLCASTGKRTQKHLLNGKEIPFALLDVIPSIYWSRGNMCLLFLYGIFSVRLE